MIHLQPPIRQTITYKIWTQIPFTVPGPPENFHVVATTTTQCKVTWDAPNEMNGVIKGYHVYNGKNKDMQYEISCQMMGYMRCY